MSARSHPAGWRAPARPSPGGLAPRALALVALMPILATLLVHAASAADPVRTGRWLDPAAARRAGVAVQLRAHAPSAPELVEVLGTDGGALEGTLLALATDGSMAAFADAIGPAATTLALARADGAQLRIAVDGVLSATFAEDGESLVIVDGRGGLSTLAVASGELRPIAEGPFVAAPLVEPDGAVLALAVPSVEAPYASRLVRVASDGSQVPVSDETLVYEASRLADGALALVVHRPGGTQVRRLGEGGSTLELDLGPDAVNVSLSADRQVIAWERAGRAFVRAGGETRSLGDGSRPEVGPDGATVLIHLDDAVSIVDLQGREVLRAAASSGFAPCAGGCRS